MDKTLLRKSSGVEYVKYLAKRRQISPRELVGVLLISAQYTFNLLDFPKAMARLSRRVRGGDAVATKALCDRWFAEELVREIAPKAVERARLHAGQGDDVIVLSASTQFAVEPVASHLGLEYRCTELEVVDDRLTGAVVGEPCYGEGKLIWARRLAAARMIDLSACTFYTDSYSDRALLEAVGRPVAVNPDPKLLALARSRGWQIERFY